MGLILALGAPTSPDSKFSFSPSASCGATSAAKRRLDVDDEDEDDDEMALVPPVDTPLTCVQSYCGCTCTIVSVFPAGCGCANPVCNSQAEVDASVLAAGAPPMALPGAPIPTIEGVCNLFGRPTASCSTLNTILKGFDARVTTVDCKDLTADQRANMCLEEGGGDTS